jgi:hypothetical protein
MLHQAGVAGRAPQYRRETEQKALAFFCIVRCTVQWSTLRIGWPICRYFAGKTQVTGVRYLYACSHLWCGEHAIMLVA